MTIGRSPDADVFLDDVTVSRDHALLVQPRRRLVPRRLRLAQRHLRQPPADRLAPARGRRRAADRQVQAHLPRAVIEPVAEHDADAAAAAPTQPGRARHRAEAPPPAARQVADDRRRLQGALAGVPRHLDLEDPLPRGPEAARAAAHARRLPALLDERRLAAAHDPAPAARRVPAAAGDPPGARGRARGARGRQPAADGAPRHRRAAGRGAAAAHVLDRRSAARCTRSRTWSRTPAPSRAWSPSSRTSASSRARSARGHEVLRRDRARDRARGHRARALRRRRAQPARVPHLGRPRVGAAAADPRARRCARATRERRKEAVEALENLAAVATHLKHLLLVRDLRRIAR